jgi:integrase
MRDQRSGGEMPNVRRKYLSPDEARRLIEAAGRVGRKGERDKLMLTLMYRHGLRVSEVTDLRWTDFDLGAPRDRPFYVRRLKGSKDTVHTLEPDTVRGLRRARMTSDGQYVFRLERGGPLSADALQTIVARAGRVWFISAVRSPTSRSRARCSVCTFSWDSLFSSTNRMVGRVAASAHATAGRWAFFCALT